MLEILREHYDIMANHALKALPNEGCGLIAGIIEGNKKIIKKVYPLKNTDESPEHFSMDPSDQFRCITDMRSQGLVMLGNFHSHPSTPARPSQEDIRLAFDSSLSYLIVSLKDSKPVLKSFLIEKGIAKEENYKVLEQYATTI
ncbi:MAG: Mov34/MPN/PAD [Oscillospiraceae bacterium]|jgi:proteasome lid subunit RPN8/RPN11|nr:Mov34/MPN/PAD [Oscillospiraceae bacterium]